MYSTSIEHVKHEQKIGSLCTE